MNDAPRYITIKAFESFVDATLNSPKYNGYDLHSITPVMRHDSFYFLIVMELRPLSYRDARGILSQSDEHAEESIDRVREE